MDVAPGEVAGADIGADQQPARIRCRVRIGAETEQGSGTHAE